MSLEPGTLLRDRYRVVRLIKSGGMGSVCEATDVNLADAPCAIKEILDAHAGGTHSQYVRDSFEKEMRSLVALDHYGIPKVRDFFEEGDRRYIVMEFVQGVSLDDEVARCKKDTGKGLEPSRVVGDMLQLLDVISYLHGLKPPILHRDIKPANIIRVERSGRLKLVDFGLAKALTDTVSPNTMVGTLGFCAPEQLSGKVEPRSDLYSVGATMFYLLTGEPPQLSFDPMQVEISGLDRIVAKATEPRVASRYANCAELIADLQAWSPGQMPMVAPEPQATPGPAAPVSSSLNRYAPWALGGLVAIALSAGVMAGRGAGPTPTPTPTLAVVVTPTPSQPLPTVTPTPVDTTKHPGVGAHPLGPLGPMPVRHRRPPPPLPEEKGPEDDEPVAVQPIPSIDGAPGYPTNGNHHVRAPRLGRRPKRSGGPTSFQAGNSQGSSERHPYNIANLRRQARNNASRMAEALNDFLPEQWQYDPQGTNEVGIKGFIAMRGVDTSGGYLLRRGAVYKITLRPPGYDSRALANFAKTLK